MSDWISIGEPEPAPLTPTQKRIKELLDQGKKVYEIVWAVHMGKDFVREEIYQIRKWESIMGKGKLNNTQRAAIYQAWKDGTSQAELARQYCVSDVSIHQLIKKLNAADDKLNKAEPLKKTQINKEFDAAVDEMIAESKAADAEKKSAIEESEPEQLEDCENGIPNTPLVPQPETALPKLPDVIFDALTSYISDLNLEIEAREQRIEELKEELLQLRDKHYSVTQWLEDHA